MPSLAGAGVGAGFGARRRRWSPVTSGLTLDLDAADSGIALSSGKVQTLPDRSGGARHFSQLTSANQPPWSATDGPQGGPAIVFGGSPQFLGGPTLTNVYAAGAFTLIVVAKPNAVVNNVATYYSNDPIFGDQSAYASMNMRATAGTPSLICGVYAGAQSATAPGLVVGQWQILVQRLANPTLTVQRAGDAKAVASTGPIGSLSAPMRLGGGVNSLYGQVSVRRVLTWNRALSDAELLIEQRGLGSLYGLVSP